MNILLIAPSAPPKNSAEAMQVLRYLSALDKTCRITLVTTPLERGWEAEDSTLRVELPNTEMMTVNLPFHRYTKLVMARPWLRRLHVPDSEAWLVLKAGEIVRRLKRRPDVIYSRSFPLSAALLARELKARLRVPWLMHLSDPWADGPYRAMGRLGKALDETFERRCFSDADAITLTTDEQRAYYATKYPEHESKLAVTPNVMPSMSARASDVGARLDPKERVHIVHTGAFYGHRRPTAVLAAMRQLDATAPNDARKLQLWFAGNMSPDVAAEIRARTDINVRMTGMLSFAETRKLQGSADILLSIEPDDDHELLKGILLSKMVDYIAARKPILAVTPNGSVSSKWCARGYGWSVHPGDVDGFAKLLASIVTGWGESKVLKQLPEPPDELRIESAVQTLSEILVRVQIQQTGR